MREGFPSGYMPKEEQEQAWKNYQDTALPGDKAQPVPGATLVVPRARDAGYSGPASNDPLDARYTELLRQRSEADRTQMAVAAGRATELNPDAAAKVVRLATDTGLPRDTVDRRTKDVEAQQRQLEERYFNQLTHPVIKEYLKDPYNAAITKDDPSFDLIDKLLNSITRSYHNTRAAGTITAATSNQKALSILDTVEQAEAEGKLDTIKDDKDPLGFRFMNPEQRATFRSSLTGATAQNLVDLESRNKIIAALPGIDPIVAGAMSAKNASDFWHYFSQKPLEFILTIGAESAVQSTAIGATAYLSGGSVPLTAAVAGAGSYGMDYGASILEALRNEGVNLQDRGAIEKALQDKNLMKRVTQYAHSHAAPVALLDAIAGGRAGGVRSMKGVALNTLEQGALGAAGEAAGQVATGKKELEFGEIAAEFFGEMVTAPIEASGALAASWRKHLQAKEAQSFFTALGKTAEASKLRERMPEHLQELVNKITADGPIENVYIEPRAFVQYFQSKNISPSVAAQQLFGDDAPLQQALAQGHDLEIPLGVYTAKLAGTEHNAPLSMDLKFNPTDLSVRETESLMQDAKNEAQIEANKAKDKAGEESVGSIVSKGLQDAGYEKQTADLLAKQMDSFFEAQAKRTGRASGMELFKEYALRILGKSQQKTKEGGLEIVQDQPAYHGSKHIFEKFDITKIGTGQGAQVHGWGLYFAKWKATADINYRRKYGGVKIEGVPAKTAQMLENEHINFVHAYRKAQSDQQRLELLVSKKTHLVERSQQATRNRVREEKLLKQAVESDYSKSSMATYRDKIQMYREEEADLEEAKAAIQKIIDDKAYTKDGAFKIGHGGRLYEVDIKAEDTEMLDLEAPLDEQRAGFDRQAIKDRIKELLDKLDEKILDEVKKFQDRVYADDINWTDADRRAAERKVQDFEWKLQERLTGDPVKIEALMDKYGPNYITDEQDEILGLRRKLDSLVIFTSEEEQKAAIDKLIKEYETTLTAWGLDPVQTGDAEEFYTALSNGQFAAKEVGGSIGAALRWLSEFSDRWDNTVNATIVPPDRENTPIAKLLRDPVVEQVLDEYGTAYDAEAKDTGRTLYKALVLAARDGMNELYDAINAEQKTVQPATIQFRTIMDQTGPATMHFRFLGKDGSLMWEGMVGADKISSMWGEDFDETVTDFMSYESPKDSGFFEYNNSNNRKFVVPGQPAQKVHNPTRVTFDEPFTHNGTLWWHINYWDEKNNLLWGGDVKDADIVNEFGSDLAGELFGTHDFQEPMSEKDKIELGLDPSMKIWEVPGTGPGGNASDYGPWPEPGAKRQKFNSPEEVASKFLLSKGIKGLNYVGGQDGPAMVIFDDSLIDIKSYEQNPFPKSKVKSIVYHGTASNFKKFSNRRIGENFGSNSAGGIFFTNKPKQANEYAGIAADLKAGGSGRTSGPLFNEYERGANVRPSYIDMQNPLIVKADPGKKIVTKWPGGQENIQIEGGFFNIEDYLNADTGEHQKSKIADLRKQGYDGIIFTHLDGRTKDYMVFDPKQIKSAITLDQKTEDGARGRMIKYGNFEYDIQLLETADLSTFLHESGHLYLEILWNLATEQDASPQVRKDLNTILKWLGAEPGKPLAYEQHEQFARGIEAYFMEGKAPSADLQGAFARFRAWLMVIYKKLTSLDVRLNDDIRQVMDRMFATEEAIDAAQKENIIVPVFATPEEAGMTPEEFDRYLQTIQTANIRAREEIQTRLMREWKREQTAWWDAQRALVREEVRAEAVKDPGVVAYTTLRFGKDVDGNELPEEQQIKLDRAALITLYGKDNPILEQLRKYNLYRKEGGIAPDAAADLLGFKSGDELARAALASVNWKQKVEEQTDVLMKERYGDMLIDGTMADQATEAMNNYERSKILHAELKALTKKRNEVAPFVQEERNRQRAERSRGLDTVRGVPSLEIFQRMAKQQIGLMPLRSINPNKFLVAARRSSVEAVDAATKGDYTTAARAKQQELFNLELYREARNAQRDIEKMLDFAKKMGTPQVRRRVGLAGGDFLDQIDAILERFDFKEVSALTAEKRLRLSEWIAQKERQGLTVDLPDYVVEEANRKPYRSLTLDEFKGVFDSLKHIDHLARLKNKLLKAKDKRELQVILADVESTIRDSARKNDKSKLGKRLPQDETLRFIDSYFASHRKLASIIREMDGFKDGGTLWSLIMRPLNEAANNEATMIHEAGQKLKELFAPYVSTQEQLKSVATAATGGMVEYGMYKREQIPEINDSMSKMERLVVALNLGNADNRAKIKAGYGWSDAQIEAILQPLTKADWDFVQGVWDFVDSYWPQIEAKEKRVKGIAPERVEPTPVNTPFGTYRGGYFPLKYEERSPGGQRAYGDRAREAAELMMRGAYTQATTKRGHTKERVEGVRMPVRLDFGVIYEHVHQVVHDLTHHEALIDANKIVGARQTQIAIIESYGDIVYDQIRHTLEAVAAGEIPAQTAFEKSVNWLRHGVSIAAMGWNLTTSLLQPLGLSQSIVRIGAPWVFKGAMRTLGDAARFESTAKWVHAKSEFMKNRHTTLNREINEIRNQMKGELGVTGNSFFWLIAMGQRVADFPTWVGMYEKQMNAGKDEETAIALADQAVLDSQGGGQVKDLAQIQRGSPLMKLWTNFYSYFNVTYNMTAESYRRTSFKSPTQIAALAVDLLLLYTVPAVLGFMMKETLRGDPPEEDLMKRLAAEQAGYIFGTMAGFREFSSVIQGYFGYEGPAGTRFYSEMAQFMKQAQQGEWDEALWKSINNTAGIVLHYPAGQVQRTVDGYVAWTEDRASPMAILVGPPKEK